MSEVRISTCARKLYCSDTFVSGNVGTYDIKVVLDPLWLGYDEYYLTFRRSLCPTVKVYLSKGESSEEVLGAEVPSDVLVGCGKVEIGLCAKKDNKVLSSELAVSRVFAGADDTHAIEWPKLATLTATLSAHGGTLGFDSEEYDGIGEVILPPIDNLTPENIREGVSVLDVCGIYEGQKYAREGIYVEEHDEKSELPSVVYYGYDAIPENAFSDGNTVNLTVSGFFSKTKKLTANATDLEYGILSNNGVLTEVKLPRLQNVKQSIFNGDIRLESVTLGSSGYPVSSISQYAFSGMDSLGELYIYTESGQPIDDEAWLPDGVSVTYYSA